MEVGVHERVFLRCVSAGDFHRLHRAVDFDGHQLFIVVGVIRDTSMISKEDRKLLMVRLSMLLKRIFFDIFG